MRYKRLLLLLIFLSISITGICQTTNPVNTQDNQKKSNLLNVLKLSGKVGDALTSTGIEQFPPQLGNVAVVSPDVLCIEINDCRILPIRQIPYIADPADVITERGLTGLGEKRVMLVVRDGFPLGTLVGIDRKTIALYDRIVGKHLNTDVADLTVSYQISSTGDNNYVKPLSPGSVSRKSKPTGWTDTSWQLDHMQQYTATHYLYLKLPFPLKTGQSYLISLPALSLNRSAFYYVHDPVYVRSEAVHVSQIGFRADDPDKNAYLSLWMGNGGGFTYPENIEFSLINDKTNQRVFAGKGIMQWKGITPEGVSNINHNGTDIVRLDFSNFSTPGRYRVCVEGIGCGYPFDIDDVSTWKHAFEISMKGMFQLRSGIPMLPPFTDFVRPRSFHPADGVKVYQSTCPLLNSGNGLNALGTDKNNFGNLVAGKTNVLVPEAFGGMMDAGDWDRRIGHLSTPRLYLELFEMNPDYFKNLCLNIPESANDLPDIIDEVIYALDIYRRMQKPDGGIRGGVESSEHPIEGSTSWQEEQTVLAYAPDHWSSYIYAGVAARAAYVLKMLGKNDFAKLWETSAVRAMEWAEVEYQRWMASPDYAKVTERAKRTIPGEQNLAAIELYRLTKDKRWNQVYLSTRKSSRTEAAFVYARLDPALADKKIQKVDIDTLIAEADRLVESSAKNAFGFSSGRLGGSNPASPTLVRAHYLTGNPRYLKTMLRSAIYSAGANPMNMCLTTGLGENYPQNPLHEDSKHTGQPSPVGITVFGPNDISTNAGPGSDLEARLNTGCTPVVSKWPLTEGYFDVFWFVTQNEYVVNTLGASEYIWGYMASRKK